MNLSFLSNEELFRAAADLPEVTPEYGHELLIRFEQLLDEAQDWDYKEVCDGDDPRGESQEGC